MGVSLGREGALKQAGAAIASKLAGWFRLTPAEQRLLVACAAGAGMAAAYNVPFGGAIFVVGVLLGTLSLPLMLPALAASFIATGVSFVLLPAKPTYTVPSYALHLPDVLWSCLAGPVLGLGAFVWLRLVVWADAAVPKGWKQAVWTVVVFTALGAVAVRYPEVLGNGKGVVQKAYLDEFGLGMLLPPVLSETDCGAGRPEYGIARRAVYANADGWGTAGRGAGAFVGDGAAYAAGGSIGNDRISGGAGRRDSRAFVERGICDGTDAPRRSADGTDAAGDRGSIFGDPETG